RQSRWMKGRAVPERSAQRRAMKCDRMLSAPSAAPASGSVGAIDRLRVAMSAGSAAVPGKCNFLPDPSIPQANLQCFPTSSPGRRDKKPAEQEAGTTRKRRMPHAANRARDIGRRYDMISAHRRTLLRVAGLTAMVAALGGIFSSSAIAQDKLRIGY